MITVESDAQPGEALLQTVMRHGSRLRARVLLQDIRERARIELASLPDPIRGLEPSGAYRVNISPALQALSQDADRRIVAGAAKKQR